MEEYCEWTPDVNEEYNGWMSECDQYWYLEEGTPRENGMIYCPFCGLWIRVLEKEEKEEEK